MESDNMKNLIKLSVFTLAILLAFVLNSNAQTSTHSITSNGETTTVRTTCYGNNCRSTISTVNHADEYARRRAAAELKTMCKVANDRWGKNLERHPSPGDFVECVKDVNVRRRLRDEANSRLSAIAAARDAAEKEKSDEREAAQARITTCEAKRNQYGDNLEHYSLPMTDADTECIIVSWLKDAIIAANAKNAAAGGKAESINPLYKP